MARILVSTPMLEGYVRAETDLALRNLDPCGHELVHHFVKGWGIAYARNLMALEAMKQGCDYLFMVDSDVVVPSDALKMLVGLDISAGWYPRGTDPLRTNVAKKIQSGWGDCFSVEEMEGFAENGVDLIDVKGCGMGCAIIRTQVFERLPHPWFKFEDYPSGNCFGEDYWFCHQARSAGMNVYVSPKVKCGHIRSELA